MEPKVLILDEPTAGLDPRGRDMILGEIQQYHQEKKNTILLVSHSMEDIAKYATKVLVMNQAQVYAYDTVEAVFSRVEELRALGLGVPQITRVFYQLKQDGMNIETNVYSVKRAKQLILEKLGKGGDAQ